MIRTFLDVCSGHLAAETWRWLDAMFAAENLRDPGFDMAGQLAGGPTRHGWLVYAPDTPPENIPADLARVLADARRQGAAYVLFDCDAPIDRNRPVLHPDFTDSD